MAAAKSKGEPQGRRREIAGICLLAAGVFCALSLLSMHTGRARMMGPGGAATAAGLYSLAGVAAYGLVAAMLLIAVRCFRERLLPHGAVELMGSLGIIVGLTVLLHLPFADQAVTLRGPGGLIGQWLGEIIASFVGGVGAALAAATILSISLLLVTDVRVSEVISVLGWAGRLGWRGLAFAGRNIGRVVVAMFPEREARADADEPHRAREDRQIEEPTSDEVGTQTSTHWPAPVLIDDGESEAVRVGRSRAAIAQEHEREQEWQELDDPPQARAERQELSHEEEERRAVAALVAEVAAVECAADAHVQAEAQGPLESWEPFDEERPTISIAEPIVISAVAELDPALAGLESPTNDEAPIIVEQAFRASEPDSHKDIGPGFISLQEGGFTLPSTEMLEYQPPQGGETDKQGLIEMAERLEQAMGNYGVRGKVKEIHMGPVVTMFEFVPAPGTRTGKVAQLENDLAMALEAQAVRIVAPIPGKAAVGVEVPNKSREMVYLKEILMDDSFQGARSKLQIALGKDIKGAPVSVNLSKMPHLLVAGTTGSGKSVAVNSMITSILYNASPEDVRFIMVDPKMLELSIYEGIPHLLLPVVTDPKKANLALRWAVEEMERRYEMLAKAGVRDVASYNARIEGDRTRRDAGVALVETPSKRAKRLRVMITGEDGVEREIEVESESAPDPIPAEELTEQESDRAAAMQFEAENAEPPARKLPYIVIVIDEFADLMMVAPKDVETSVARIAQKARAAGLHLILATQRPSVDVITGLIKANFPSRIALQVASKIDARTILDQPGAETLLGNGDMLFSDRGTKLRRIHGAFLSDDEVHRVVEFLKTQAKPVYDMDIIKPREEDSEDGGPPADDFHDELYDKAVAIVCETRQASVSFIQRRLQIGYNRSARMVEQMERDGFVGPANGIKPREILAPQGEYLTSAP